MTYSFVRLNDPPRMSCSEASPATIILVADAAPLLRCGLQHTLAQAFGECQLLEAATMPELLRLAAQQLPQLILLAPNLPEAPADPAALLRALRDLHPEVAVVVLADPDTTSELDLLRLLRQNVNGLLLRTATLAEVRSTVGTVLRHGRCDSEFIFMLLHSHLQRQTKLPQTAVFSGRQLEVLRLVAQDLTNEEIAECLFTSVRTVEYHRSQMLQKAGTRTTLGLVLFALRQGLLPPNVTPLPRP